MKNAALILLSPLFLVGMTLSAQAQGASTRDLELNSQERMLHRRAVDAVIWSMPLVNFQAMRDGLKKDAGIACYPNTRPTGISTR